MGSYGKLRGLNSLFLLKPSNPPTPRYTRFVFGEAALEEGRIGLGHKYCVSFTFSLYEQVSNLGESQGGVSVVLDFHRRHCLNLLSTFPV